jgi:hypothetical protein
VQEEGRRDVGRFLAWIQKTEDCFTFIHRTPFLAIRIQPSGISKSQCFYMAHGSTSGFYYY